MKGTEFHGAAFGSSRAALVGVGVEGKEVVEASRVERIEERRVVRRMEEEDMLVGVSGVEGEREGAVTRSASTEEISFLPLDSQLDSRHACIRLFCSYQAAARAR